MSQTDEPRFITVAIHTYEKAIALRSMLEREGIDVQFRNVNIEQPIVSSGIRVRIKETDLPLALRIIENRDIFSEPAIPARQANSKLPVLVPVDFSENSLKATRLAFKIAHSHATSIVLLHTYIDPYVAGNVQLTDSLTYEITDMSAREHVQHTADAQMRHFAARLKEMIKTGELPPVKFDTCVMEGVPEDAINEYTKARNPFIIVMGTRGSKRKEIELIGSVTGEVLDKCRFTVLALPEMMDAPKVGTDTRRVLFLSNVEQEDILAIDTLYRIFPKERAHVTIACVPGKKRPFMRNTAEGLVALRDYCTQNFKNYTFEIATDSLEKIMEQLSTCDAANAPFDLAVIPNKKKNVFSRLFNPSVAHRVLFAADVPMLVIPV